jgi:hypothetical protein
MKMITVRITTTSGHNWTINANPPFDHVVNSYMGAWVNIAPSDIETREQICDVELTERVAS